MINVTKVQQTEYDEDELRAHVHREGTCLSTDTKPTDWDGGSTLLEIDTGKVYAFDEENETWREL